MQLVAFLEWLWQPGVYSQALFLFFLILEYAMEFLSAAAYYWYVKSYLYAVTHPLEHKRPSQEKKLLKWIVIIGAAALLLILSSLETGWLYRIDMQDTLIFTPAYPLAFFCCFIWSVASVAALFRARKTLPMQLLLLMVSYVLIPTVFFISDMVTGMSLGCVSSAVVFFLIFVCIDNAQGERLLENKALLAKKEAEMTETKMELMMSQIQPHFLYNALSSIAYLCTEDPAEAEKATNEFSSYLRGNLQSIGAKAPIPFDIELRHVEQYLRIEKRRFADRLNIVYDIQEKDFRIPALTLQTLVENAVRYSVSAKYEPTTVTLRSRQTAREYVIQIIDDGPGFDTTAKPNDDRRHIGLAGTKYRLAEMIGGYLDIDSVIGHGTTVTIHIPKEEQA